ncbi:hypothetical protein D3C86_2246450 [compost metagenome]
MDSARTSRSTSPALTALPLDAVYVAGRATNATFGVCWRRAASSMSRINPMRFAP